MIRQLLVLVLVLSFLPGAPAAPSLQQGPKLSMKEQVLAIPAGAVVEVRTIQKEKIKGRLGEANGSETTKSKRSAWTLLKPSRSRLSRLTIPPRRKQAELSVGWFSVAWLHWESF